MRVPIRIIGIVTSIFWIFLIIFAFSAVYSIKDMQFSLGEPGATPTQDNNILLTFPVSVTNTGYYDLTSFNVSMRISDTNGSEVTSGSTFIPVVAPGQTINTTHSMELNVTGLLEANQDLLFNDSNWNVNEIVSMSAAEVVPIRASSNLSMPWGAPLYDLLFGPLETDRYNSSHLRVAIPMSFENHAFFNLTGTVKTRIYSNDNSFVGKCQINLEALEHSPFKGKLEFILPSRTISNIRLEALFETQFFTYGPMVIDFGS